MKLLITLIGWKEYPDDGHIPPASIWDLEDSQVLENLMVAFGNGVIGEMRVEGNSERALQLFRWVMQRVGLCHKARLSSSVRSELWLYREGYECYVQDGTPPGYIFVNPIPRPV